MPEIVPFIGTRYDVKAVGDLGHVVCPPYDVITPSMQEELYRRHKHNFVRLVLGKELPTDDEYNNRYERSARYFREWKSEGILTDEEELSFYLLEQEFTLPSGQHRRRGFFAAVRLDDGPQNMIRAHEHTFPGPKADRLKLLRATQCNLSPIYVLCPDPKKRIVSLLADRMASSKPLEQFADTEGVLTRLWVIQQPAEIQRFQEAVRTQSLLIADGHHRYETAMAYRAEMRAAVGKRHKNMPFDYAMMFVSSIEDDGLVILPTHRALSPELGVGIDLAEVMGDLENFFTVEPTGINMEEPDKTTKHLLDQIAPRKPKQIRLAMILPNRTGHILTLKNNVKLEEIIALENLAPAIRNLDVSILHQFIINQIWVGNPEIELDEADVIYSRDAGVILDRVKRRHACVGFLLNAPRIEQVREIAEQELRMPHKSTFFYPKIPSGIADRDMSRHQ